MTDPPPSASGPPTPRAPPAIVASTWNASGDGNMRAPAARAGPSGQPPSAAASAPVTTAGLASPRSGYTAALLPPPFSARSRQASMSHPRPVAEGAEQDEGALVPVEDVADEHTAAVGGSGRSVRIERPASRAGPVAGAAVGVAGGGVAVADIAAAKGPSLKPSMSTANKVSPAPHYEQQHVTATSTATPSSATAPPLPPNDTDKVLNEFDVNRDQRLDANELAALVSKMVQEREDKRRLVWGLGAVLVVLVVLLGALTGMTWAVVAAFKDTDVKGGVMYVKGSTSEVVQTASSEMTIVGDDLQPELGECAPGRASACALINRQALAAVNTTTATAANANGTAAVLTQQPESVVRTATFVGTPIKFSSRVNIKQLMELKYLYITGMGEVEVALVVQGVARVPDPDSVWGTVVHIITGAGTITLDDTVIRFEEGIAPVFVKAGFIVSHSRRSLLGIYDVLGFFNFISDLEVFNLPPDQPKPSLPASNFMMRLKVYEPCVFPFDPTNDRCIAPPTDGAPNPDSRRRLLQQQQLGPLAPPSPSSPVLPLLASPDAPPSAAYAGAAAAAGPAAAGERRRRTLATAPHTHARLLADAGDAGAFLHDLAGVEVVNGSRYMTHTETALVWQGFMRTVYEYALFPAYRRVEVASNSSALMSVWQEEALPDGAELTPQTWFCGQLPLPASKLDKFKDLKGTSNVNFTFLGYTELYGKSARHFRLSVRQPVDSTTTSTTANTGGLNTTGAFSLPEVVEFDYFDNRKDFSPLGFEVNHPIAGHIMIQVVEYANLTAADISSSTFAVPATATCTNDTSIPRLSSPFTVPPFYDPTLRSTPRANRDKLIAANPTPSTGRRLAEEAAQRAAEWAALDHANGTDIAAWPRWALEVYGSGGDRVHVRERLLMESGRLRGRIMQELDCYANKYTKRWEPAALPCTVEASVIQYRHLEVIGACDGSNIAAFPFLKINGNAAINTCTKQATGCTKVTLALQSVVAAVPVANLLAAWIGLRDLEMFLCAGYNLADFEGYVTGLLGTGVSLIRGELVGTLKWSPCCVWVNEVSLEGFVGVSAGSYDLSSSIGKWMIVKEPWYWKGGAVDATRNRQPEVQNQGALEPVMVGAAEWGDWGEIGYCHERLPADSGTSNARPITGFSQRLEASGGSGKDDTGLNGLKVKCTNGDEVVVEKGSWGDWSSSISSCPAGKYITAARIKIQPNQGLFTDDTAANGVEFRCSDNTVIKSGAGDYGSWSAWAACPASQYICGLQVKTQPAQGIFGDDTAVNGLRFYCCYLVA
ncbi:hypothetical protein HYH02_014894 [Chlamydomonas schloesseri]|uniref:EF-hand domain-containing protein n=1 Tax=Chlamydomonas schloesseri TaxID=2026947 RepID=A0A835VU31_9CHLO|nr:hypothetical protein HYH02_014894 [Chlamydomonas schloesseri]|eukprot:KAG2425893.1 hypothetical protein HYH02_014894 [Chlamydomonas schloesseri]